MKTTGYIAVRVDDENNAGEWWDALRASCPALAEALAADGAAVIAAGLWDALAALPGFGGGPGHAPTALIDYGDKGDGWCDVVAGPHQVFDILE